MRNDVLCCRGKVASTRGGNRDVPDVNHKTSSSSTSSRALTQTLPLFILFMVRLVGEHRTQLHGAASATAIWNKALL